MRKKCKPGVNIQRSMSGPITNRLTGRLFSKLCHTMNKPKSIFIAKCNLQTATDTWNAKYGLLHIICYSVGRWKGPCHHGMARPQLRMEERPPIWMVAANILNKQSRTADKRWSSSLWVGRGANNSSP